MGSQSQRLNSQKTVLASLHCAVTRARASLDAEIDSWLDFIRCFAVLSCVNPRPCCLWRWGSVRRVWLCSMGLFGEMAEWKEYRFGFVVNRWLVLMWNEIGSTREQQ